METIKKILQEAIGTGEVLTIVYHGGSEPGSSRMISPIKVEDKIVRARCLTTNKVKGFSIDKIELSMLDNVDYTGQHKDPEEPANLTEGMVPFINKLMELGWFIQQYENQIGLFERFKNGKPKKRPTLYLVYEIDPDSDTDKRLEKPWKTCGLAFKYFNRAVDKFMIAARELAPAQFYKAN